MLFMNGAVYLIGAGPGDPGLLTIRGAELLALADVVLYDGLSNPELLQYAPQAEKICVGKHGKSRIWTQNEIIQEILGHAKAGKIVVRLKGGDPAVFARTAEEVEAVKAAERLLYAPRFVDGEAQEVPGVLWKYNFQMLN